MKLRLKYGVDPKASETGFAFYWPGSEQARETAAAIKRHAPEHFRTAYQGEPLAGAEVAERAGGDA